VGAAVQMRLGWDAGCVPYRVLFEPEGQFFRRLGATNRASADGHDCLIVGGSASEFAEEPVVRVQSRPRKIGVVRDRLLAPYLDASTRSCRYTTLC
jgi:hypothetical protein